MATALLGLAGTAMADKGTAIPGVKGETSGLRMNVVRYEGGSNGQLTVEVLNPTASAGDFSAQGLYFIPDENANNAPQRLGAVGPFSVHGGPTSEHVSVPPSGKVTLKLDVFCIDSHRRAPATGDVFHLAGARMPVNLSNDIAANARKAATANGGYAAPAAKSAVQSEVWKARDKKWLKLEGEGRQEAGK
jgi:hypothetical protein